MNDLILSHAHDLMASPWIYVALFAFATLDAFLPVVPSESLVIMAGVFAANGQPDLVAVMAVAASGAFAGDHVSYLIGRRVGRVLLGRLRPGTRRYEAFGWAQAALVERGGVLLVAARYVPGGRTAATMTMGSVGFPARSFTCYTALAAAMWGGYCALVGYVGGRAFESDPVKGVLLGIGIALAITAAVEIVRGVRRRRTCFATPPTDTEPERSGAHR